MKKILIVSHSLEIGGAEKSLLGFLDAVDTERYEVDVFLLRREGEWLSYLPEHVRLLPEIPAYTVLARPMKDTLREGHVLLTAARLAGKIAAAFYDRGLRRSLRRSLSGKEEDHPAADSKGQADAVGAVAKNAAESAAENAPEGAIESAAALEYSHRFTRKLMPPIAPETEYDCVISFMTPHYFAAEKVRARKRIAWIHTDYSRVAVDVDAELKMWGAYDYIVSISDAVTKSFLQLFPTLAEKILPCGNVLPEKLIRALAEEKPERESVPASKESDNGSEADAPAVGAADEMPEDGTVRLLSVGRFCTAKNFDSVPAIARRIREMGIPATWYLIGYGSDEALIRQRIREEGAEDFVRILGKKVNPYPYIKACDLYVQPSRYEGKCVTVCEAQMLGKPVVITAYPTAKSQLRDGVDGVIVPTDIEGCAKGIAGLLRDSARMESLAAATRVTDYTNKNELEKVYKVL
ncbi:MAG: glycosyltransferase [Eubacterium sp.]|nr:glycosyltransferase [Eubacterium sp.]